MLVKPLLRKLDRPLVGRLLDPHARSKGVGGVTGDFYFAATGDDDTGDGSIGSPWQTVAKANSLNLGAGSSLNFNKADTFSGSITLRSGVSYGAYGTGARPIISSGADEGAVGENVQNVEIDGLHFVAGVGNATHGIDIFNSQAGNTKLPGIVVNDCEVEDYGGRGINIEGKTGESGFDAPEITNNLVHDCTGNWATEVGSAGIHIHSAASYKTGLAHVDPVVSGNTVHTCPGTAGTSNWTGSGILVAECDGGLVEDNEAYANGGASDASLGGPVGIWAADSIGVIIRGGSSHGNLTDNLDGGGYHLDGGCQDCIIENVLSYGNAGPGIMLYAYSDAGIRPFTGNIARYNILSDNADGSVYGNLHVQNDDDQGAATFQSLKVYNNTIYADGATEKVVVITGANLSGKTCTFANNLLISANAAPLIQAPTNPFIFTNNGYYASGTFEIEWNSASYSSVAAWKAVQTTQEVLYALPTQLTQNPILSSLGGTTAADYTPGAGSNAVGIGLDVVSQYGWTMPTEDCAGNAIRAGYLFDLGAVQGTLPTNLFTSPDDIDNAAWDKLQLQARTTAAGMDGGMNAQQALGTNVPNEYYGFSQLVAFASTQPTLRFSIFVKPVDFSGLALYTFIANGDSSIYAEEWVNLLSSTQGTQGTAGSITRRPARKQARPNGFFLVTMEADFTATITVGGGGVAYTIDGDYFSTAGGTKGVIQDGMHLHQLAA